MPASPHKREGFILAADAETWEFLYEVMKEETNRPGFGITEEDHDWMKLMSQIHYKLWRTSHRDEPEDKDLPYDMYASCLIPRGS